MKKLTIISVVLVLTLYTVVPAYLDIPQFKALYNIPSLIESPEIPRHHIEDYIEQALNKR